MQLTKEKLMAQQLVLFHLGFYKGNIDGIWSAATIDAKKEFEADVSFLPAYPNGGLPFGERDKLPKNWVYQAKGLIGHKSLDPEKAKQIMDEHSKRIEAAGARAKAEAAKVADTTGQVQVPQPTADVNTKTTVVEERLVTDSPQRDDSVQSKTPRAQVLETNEGNHDKNKRNG